jgi:hypothetical protein
MFATLLKWLTAGPLDRILTTVDRKMDNETERERVKAKAVETYIDAQARILTGRGWWFPLFFIAPLGVWFASVCIYSILFCTKCAYPQDWSVAALPTPIDEWAGIIIGSLFLAKSGEALIARFKK